MVKFQLGRSCVSLQSLDQSQIINPSITVTRAMPMPVISRPPLARPGVEDGAGELEVVAGLAAVPVGAAVVLATIAVPPTPVVMACPMVGSGASPSTNHPPAVELGQAGGVKFGL